MGYYKKIDKISINNYEKEDIRNYCAKETKSYMKKHGVDKDNILEIENRINSIEILSARNRSGKQEYGMSVSVLCYMESGHTLRISIDGLDLVRYIQKYPSRDGIILGNFLILMKGDVFELVEMDGNRHQEFLNSYEKQEVKKKETEQQRNTLQIGDIVRTNGMWTEHVYLGEYYYYKPNLKNDSAVNKLRKYKLFLRDSDDVRTRGIHLLAGTIKDLEFKGTKDIDVEELIEKAKMEVDEMFKKGKGYEERRSYFRSLNTFKDKNNMNYVLANVEKTKKDIKTPNKQDILNRAWLCGWDSSRDTTKYTLVKEYSKGYHTVRENE